MSRSYRMLPLAQLVPALPGFAFPKTYAAWPVWKDSTTAEVRFGLVAALLCPWFVKGLYPLFTAAIVAPLLVWLGSFATCRDRSTARVSEFLGWLSYPLYCVHGPVIETTRYLYKHSDFLSRFGIPQQILSIVC